MRKLFLFVFGFFLLLELALNATILDLVSPNFDGATIEHVLNISGYFGGFGLGLFIIRIFVIGRTDKISIRPLGACFIILIISSVAINQLQTRLVNYVVSQTDNVQRKNALVLVGASYGLMSGVYRPSNFNLSDDPTSKTGIILFPPFAIWGNALDTIENSARRVVSNTLYQQSPALKPAFDAAVTKTCFVFNENYDKYVAAAEDTRRRFFPEKFDEQYREKRDDFLGYRASLPLDLTKEEFTRHPDIQGYVRFEIFSVIANHNFSSQIKKIISKDEMLNGLNRLFARKLIDPCMSWIVFRNEYVGGIIREIDSIIATSSNNSKLSFLGDEGRFEELAKNAVVASIVPSIAFAWFLIICAFGFGFLLVGILKTKFLISNGVVAVVVVLWFGILIITPFLTQNAVINSQAYQLRRPAIEANIGYVSTRIFEWVMRSAPIIYPVSVVARDTMGIIIGINRRYLIFSST